MLNPACETCPPQPIPEAGQMVVSLRRLTHPWEAQVDGSSVAI